MAKRIDWDKARRNKNARKPDYREVFLEGRSPISFTMSLTRSGSKAATPTTTTKFQHTQPHSAREAKRHLTPFGIKGSKLNNLTNEILRGKKQLASVVCELQVLALIEQGFDPMPPEISADTAILRLIRFPQTGDDVEEATFQFRKFKGPTTR